MSDGTALRVHALMRLRNQRLIRLLAFAAAGVLAAYFKLLRLRVREDRPGLSPYGPTGDDRYLYCVWHDGIAGPTFAGRSRNAGALASRHADGAWIAHALEARGMQPVRGSSGRSGAAGALGVIEAAKRLHIVMTPDGPRGPRREVKTGLVFLASQTGRPIVPVAFEASRGWRPRGKWTDLLIPRPFARAIVWAGEPIAVPPKADKPTLEAARLAVQTAMDRMHAELAHELRAEPFPRDDTVAEQQATNAGRHHAA